MAPIRTLCSITIAIGLIGTATAEELVKPAVITADQFQGNLFAAPEATSSEEADDDGAVYQTEDLMPFTSSDERLYIGAFRTTGPHRFDIEEPYGVDEYMHFLKGGVTLTSSDGEVLEVKAGDSLMMPKEWTGTWQSDGYEKIYVIYDSTEEAAEAE